MSKSVILIILIIVTTYSHNAQAVRIIWDTDATIQQNKLHKASEAEAQQRYNGMTNAERVKHACAMQTDTEFYIKYCLNN